MEKLEIIRTIKDETITVLCFFVKSNKRSKNAYNKNNNPVKVSTIILKVVSILFNNNNDLNKYT
ncbi:MAG: hypothetical protein OSJ65_07795 [Bacilli bacterium]|nr:hypothetical protein [Bacilli bacterium]